MYVTLLTQNVIYEEVLIYMDHLTHQIWFIILLQDVCSDIELDLMSFEFCGISAFSQHHLFTFRYKLTVSSAELVEGVFKVDFKFTQEAHLKDFKTEYLNGMINNLCNEKIRGEKFIKRSDFKWVIVENVWYCCKEFEKLESQKCHCALIFGRACVSWIFQPPKLQLILTNLWRMFTPWIASLSLHINVTVIIQL